MKLEIAARTNDSLGEGVIWNHEDNKLYWVDAFGPTLRRMDLVSSDIESWSMPEVIGSIVFDHRGTLVVGLESGYHRLRLEPFTLSPIHNPQPEDGIIFNDGKCDRAGRYFIGTMHRDFHVNAGVLWRLDPDLTCHRIDHGITVSNGLAWSPDNRTMYLADTRKDVVYAYDYEIETGSASNRRLFLSTEGRPGRVDGATTDAEGNYWAAMIHEGAVACFSPQGVELRRVDLPVAHPTMCTFGGPGLDRLFVATSRRFLDEAGLRDQPLAGSMFVVDELDAKGLPETFFAG